MNHQILFLAAVKNGFWRFLLAGVLYAVFVSVAISQEHALDAHEGSWTISADSIEFDIKDNFQLLKGKVHIESHDLVLNSDRAKIYFKDNEILSFVLNGAPVKVIIKTQDTQVNAQAEQVHYEALSQILDLQGQVSIVRDNQHLTSDKVRYDIKKARFVAQGKANQPQNGGVRLKLRSVK